MLNAVTIEGTFAMACRNPDLLILQFELGIGSDDNFIEAKEVG